MENKKKIIAATTLLLIALIIIIYYLFTNNIESNSNTNTIYNDCNDIATTENEIALLINNNSVIIDLSGDEIYNATELTTEFDNEILVCNSKGYEILINNNEYIDDEIFNLELDTLNNNEYINITIKDKNSSSNYQIRTLHENINFTVSGESTDGYYYFDYNNSAVKTDSKGNVVFYKTTDFIRNFKKYEIDGNVYYGYLERSDNYDNITVDGASHMRLIVLDEEYNQIDQVEHLLTDNGISNNHSIENHDYQILDLGHYIVTSYVASEVSNVPNELLVTDTENVKVAAAVFQEIKDGELIF